MAMCYPDPLFRSAACSSAIRCAAAVGYSVQAPACLLCLPCRLDPVAYVSYVILNTRCSGIMP